MRYAASIAIACVLASPAGAAGLSVRNLGFEAWNDAGRPEGWFIRQSDDYTVTADCAMAREGRCSIKVESTRGSAGTYQPVGQQIAPGAAAGHVVKLSGYIRTREVSGGWAGLWMRVDARGRPNLALENMEKRGPRGTSEWQRFEIELPVAANAATISFGVLLAGSGTAWFDDLRLAVDDSIVVPAVALPARPEPSPALAADDSMRLRDSDLPKVDAAARADVRERARPIRSLASDDFSDLEFLRPLLREKRIVQLGESAHGVAEYNWLKVRLVKFLHRSLGFDVIAFESSLGGCQLADERVGAAAAEDVMRACIFSVWHTAETLPLFEYVAAERAAGRTFDIAGIDVQASGFVARDVSARLVRYAAIVDADLARRIEEAEKKLTRTAAKENPDAMRKAYAELAEGLERKAQTLRAANPANPLELDLVIQEARSRLHFVDELANFGVVESYTSRDLGMADNLDFLADRMFRGRKIVVWAHNYHVAKVPENPERGPNMGSWVAKRRGAEVYTIGFYMGHGLAAQNDRTLYDILPPPANSLDAILANAGWKVSFVDLSAAKPPAWAREPVVARAWGTLPSKIVPAASYDGLVYVDTVTPPQYR